MCRPSVCQCVSCLHAWFYSHILGVAKPESSRDCVAEEVSGALSVPNKPSGFCGRKAVFTTVANQHQTLRGKEPRPLPLAGLPHRFYLLSFLLFNLLGALHFRLYRCMCVCVVHAFACVCVCGPVAVGFRRRTLASSLGPPQNPTTWTTRDRVPYAPKH